MGYKRVRGAKDKEVLVFRKISQSTMSALGHSLPMRLVSASHDVRSTPKADIRFQRNICSDGPISDIA